MQKRVARLGKALLSRQFCADKRPAKVAEGIKVIESHLRDLPSLDLERARQHLNLKQGASVTEIRTAYEKHSKLD